MPSFLFVNNDPKLVLTFGYKTSLAHQNAIYLTIAALAILLRNIFITTQQLNAKALLKGVN
jgi:hypothetical protein